MSRTRLHAPSENGAVFAQPELDKVGPIMAQNRAALDAWQYDFQGRSAEHVRNLSRRMILDAARDYVRTDGQPAPLEPSPATSQPASQTTTGSATRAMQPAPLIVTGHQPELFHPGVWVKNFASNELARRHHGTALHLIVDNDTVKKTTVRLPTGPLSDPSVVHVPFDRWRDEIPFEQYEVADRGLFRDFGDRVNAILEPIGFRPLAADFWRLACTACGDASRLGECLARARRWQENQWGCRNLELPVSRLCETEGFLWFAAHILAQINRFRTAYNTALAEYRQRNRIRSRNHPVPSLAEDGEWQEAPFWVWNDRSPRRRQLFVRQLDRTMILTDRQGWTEEIPLAPDREACCAVEVLADLPQRGIKVRTRALTTTIFSRLCLGDLFIHGLGGARYDELTDQIIERFFAVAPPQFMILTGTLRLPFPARPGTVDKLHELGRFIRDLRYNPDRLLDGTSHRSPDIEQLISQKRELIWSLPQSSADRRHRFNDIRRINSELQPYVSDVHVRTQQRIAEVRSDLSANSILLGRDWPFLAYPAESLRRFFQQVSG